MPTPEHLDAKLERWAPVLYRLWSKIPDGSEWALPDVLKQGPRMYGDGSPEEAVAALREVLRRYEEKGYIVPIAGTLKSMGYWGVDCASPRYYFAAAFRQAVQTETVAKARRAFVQSLWPDWGRPFLIAAVAGAVGGIAAARCTSDTAPTLSPAKADATSAKPYTAPVHPSRP